MTNAAGWTLIVSALAPLLVAVVQRPNLSKRVRSLIMLAAAVVDGLLTTALSGEFHGKTPIAMIALAVVAIESAYNGLWKPTGVAPIIELRTSPASTYRSLSKVA
ncbi:MAG: hypothetical protein ACJ73S_00055 [Mycobacteriales bacterium]|jgi:drug/metabolite transporter (DMT)-like permease